MPLIRLIVMADFIPHQVFSPRQRKAFILEETLKCDMVISAFYQRGCSFDM